MRFRFPIATEIKFDLPPWALDELENWPDQITNSEVQMDLAIRLSDLNVEHDTGGPFGAAIFDHDGTILAVGVNRVVPCHCSLLHAENVALSLAQQATGNFTLRSDTGPRRLVTSAAPCVSCFGNFWWSGVKELLIGARKEDVEAIGFDEGPIHPQWREQLDPEKGYLLVEDLRRVEACVVLARFAKHNRLIYNG